MFSLGFLQYCRVNLSLRILNLPSWQFFNWIMQNRSWTFQFNYSEDQIQTTDSNKKKKESLKYALVDVTVRIGIVCFKQPYTQNFVLTVFVCVKVTGKLPEAVARRRSVKKVFLEISQHSQENTCAKVFLQASVSGCFRTTMCF